MSLFFRPRHLLPILLLLQLFGCEEPPSRPAPEPAPEKSSATTATARPAETRALLSEPAPTTIVETATEALPVWRSFRELRPTLVLLSRQPFLDPIPPALQDKAVELTLYGSAAAVAERASRPGPDPVLFPGMALSAALAADLVGEIVWVYPSRGTAAEIDFEAFRRQLVESGAATEEEAAGFAQTADALRGSLRGHPLRMVTLGELPDLDGPVLLHLDPGFFAPLYRHEIGTPIYGLVSEILNQIKEKSWKALGVTVAPSNLSGALPLDTRFLAADLATLFTNPPLLEEGVPENWTRRGQILYLENFFQKDEILDRYLAMEQEAPGDPSIQYGLYQIQRQRKEGNAALEYLDRAVALDPVYALAYLDLAEVALERQRPDAALQMLDKAVGVFPDNPFIRLRKAAILEQVGNGEEAGRIMAEVRELPWSPVYFPQAGRELRESRTPLTVTPGAEALERYGR